MAASIPTLADLAVALDRIERKVDGLAARRATPRLLSKRQAAKLLGVGRRTTLEDLITARRLRVVKVGDGVKIPAAEVERLAMETEVGGR